MNSFNHYALGAIGDWLHRDVAGLAPGAPGYRVLDVHIRPGGSLTSATASHVTPYGLARTSWRIDGCTLHTEVIVPPNCTAEVRIIADQPVSIGSGTHTWETTLV